MAKRNRRNPFIDDFFGLDIHRFMNEMDEYFRSIQNEFSGKPGEPMYYGYSVNIGPDGIPHVKEFGNVRPDSKQWVDPKLTCGPDSSACDSNSFADTRVMPAVNSQGKEEPYTCCSHDEKKNNLKIHADIPGISKEDIDLELKGNVLILSAKNEYRDYYKEIPLEYDVTPGSIKAEYNNGVLEITLKCKNTKQKKSGKKIKVN